MILSFTCLSKPFYMLKQVIGLSVAEFEKVMEKVRERWEKIESQEKI